MPYDEVMLIRCLPDAPGAQALMARLQAGDAGRLLVFFHGPGLAWASSEAARHRLPGRARHATLMLCSAGWRRLQAGLPPQGWQLGSLVQFWDAADRADRVGSLGALGD